VQRAMHPFEWAATLNSLGLTPANARRAR
jgi:hypothetical protein